MASVPAKSNIRALVPPSRRNPLALDMRLTLLAMRRSLQDHLTFHGVRYPQWVYLRALWLEDGISQYELSKRVARVEGNTVSLLKGLERDGLIERRRSATDKRSMNVFLTVAGRELEKQMYPGIKKAEQLALTGVSARDVQTFKQVMLAIRRNLGEATD